MLPQAPYFLLHYPGRSQDFLFVFYLPPGNFGPVLFKGAVAVDMRQPWNTERGQLHSLDIASQETANLHSLF